jgi:hypothetical protein
VEEYPDLAAAREKYDKECKRQRQEAAREQKKRELLEQQEREKDKHERSYDRIMQVTAVRLHPPSCCMSILSVSMHSHWTRGSLPLPRGCTDGASERATTPGRRNEVE